MSMSILDMRTILTTYGYSQKKAEDLVNVFIALCENNKGKGKGMDRDSEICKKGFLTFCTGVQQVRVTPDVDEREAR